LLVTCWIWIAFYFDHRSAPKRLFSHGDVHMPTLAIVWAEWALIPKAIAPLTSVMARTVADVSLDVATLGRTIVAVVVLTAIVVSTVQWPAASELNARALSGLGTGASWLRYFRASRLVDVSRQLMSSVSCSWRFLHSSFS
jgi:uncharacterized membrane protein